MPPLVSPALHSLCDILRGSSTRHTGQISTTRFDQQHTLLHTILPMDHLCPRLSFPLAPCLSCISRPAASGPAASQASRKHDSAIQIPSAPTAQIPTSYPTSRITAQQANCSVKRAPRPPPPRRLPSIPQNRVIQADDLIASIITLSRMIDEPIPDRSVLNLAPRKDSATAPWLQPFTAPINSPAAMLQ